MKKLFSFLLLLLALTVHAQTTNYSAVMATNGGVLAGQATNLFGTNIALLTNALVNAGFSSGGSVTTNLPAMQKLTNLSIVGGTVASGASITNSTGLVLVDTSVTNLPPGQQITDAQILQGLNATNAPITTTNSGGYGSLSGSNRIDLVGTNWDTPLLSLSNTATAKGVSLMQAHNSGGLIVQPYPTVTNTLTVRSSPGGTGIIRFDDTSSNSVFTVLTNGTTVMSNNSLTITNVTGNILLSNSQITASGGMTNSPVNGVINPLNAIYGVTGDGRTDDTAALQTAINAGGNVGGVIQFPPGPFVYLITSPIWVPSTTTLRGPTTGEALGSSANLYLSNTGCLILSNGGRCEVDNLYFKSASAGTVAIKSDPTVSAFSPYNVFKHDNFRSFSNAIALSNAWVNSFHDCGFLSNGTCLYLAYANGMTEVGGGSMIGNTNGIAIGLGPGGENTYGIYIHGVDAEQNTNWFLATNTTTGNLEGVNIIANHFEGNGIDITLSNISSGTIGSPNIIGNVFVPYYVNTNIAISGCIFPNVIYNSFTQGGSSNIVADVTTTFGNFYPNTYLGNGSQNVIAGGYFLPPYYDATNATLYLTNQHPQILNIGIGGNALIDLTQASNNFAAGNGALQNLTVGGRNIGIGLSALSGILTNSNNVAIGNSALSSGSLNPTGVPAGGLVAIGDSAMSSDTTGTRNTGVGYNAGNNNATGNNNTWMGYGAGQSGGSQSGNTLTGQLAAYQLAGGDNTGTGNDVFENATIGVQNVGIGSKAGVGTGSGVTYVQNSEIIGYNADNLVNGGGLQNDIHIGEAVSAPAAGETNMARIGNPLITNMVLSMSFVSMSNGNASVSPPPVLSGYGTLWNSNGVLYWVNGTHTNYVAGP